MVSIYVSLYKKGLRTLEQIPAKYRPDVKAVLIAEGYIVPQEVQS